MLPPAAAGYVGSAIPSALFMGGEKAVTLVAVRKAFDMLAQGAGRAVLSSSQGEQSSYVRKRSLVVNAYQEDGSLTAATRVRIEIQVPVKPG